MPASLTLALLSCALSGVEDGLQVIGQVAGQLIKTPQQIRNVNAVLMVWMTLMSCSSQASYLSTTWFLHVETVPSNACLLCFHVTDPVLGLHLLSVACGEALA